MESCPRYEDPQAVANPARSGLSNIPIYGGVDRWVLRGWRWRVVCEEAVRAKRRSCVGVESMQLMSLNDGVTSVESRYEESVGLFFVIKVSHG
jgi:hypothetical protein